MEAPWVRVCSKLTHVAFGHLPPRLVRWGFHPSLLEPLMIGVMDNGVVCRIAFSNGRTASAILEDWQKAWPKTKFLEDVPATKAVADQIAGKARRAGPVSIAMIGTAFQIKVWKELLKVPSGETVSYGELARRIRMPKAYRAVANAMGSNLIPILIPCHRVIATGGGIGGFGSGLGLKRMLLEAEGVVQGRRQAA
jgi:O-6-methylguanine DNA methyltransferase